MSEAFRLGWKQRLRNQWLRAQGVPEHAIFEGLWKAELFTPYPHKCVVCGRPWRPDYPEYIAVMGESRKAQVLAGHAFEWYSAELNIVHATGMAPGPQVFRLCTEHPAFGPSVPDCQTGEQVKMSPPLTRRQRAWRDARYWSGSALRFVFLLAQWAWLWAAYKVAGHSSLTVRAPWPPLRKA
jgi:hypothetical protein